MKKQIHTISEPFSFRDTIPSEYGFIPMDREFTHWPLYHDDAAWKIFTYLLMRVNYTPRFWCNYKIDVGQYVTSYAHLADDLYKSRDEIKRLLAKLKKIGEVTTKRIGNALLINMPNYMIYMNIKRHKNGSSARLKSDLSPNDALRVSIIKENNQNNHLKRKENMAPPQNFSSTGTDTFHSLGEIWARQKGVGAQLPYHFDQFPPDRAEVELYVRKNNMDINIDNFYKHYEDNCWCDLKGRKLDGWHFALNRMSKKGEYL